MEELREMTGACLECGQTKIVRARTEAEAHILATLDCSCPGGEMARRKKSVKEQLDELIGELAPDNGWDPVGQEVFRVMKGLGDCIAENKITSCAMRIDDTNLKIKTVSGKINIERSKTIKQGGIIEK